MHSELLHALRHAKLALQAIDLSHELLEHLSLVLVDASCGGGGAGTGRGVQVAGQGIMGLHGESSLAPERGGRLSKQGVVPIDGYTGTSTIDLDHDVRGSV